MNWNIVEGKWTEMKGFAKEKWGDLTDDELTQVAGKKEQLEGLLKQKYGWTQEKVDEQVSDWMDAVNDKTREHNK